MVQGRKNWRTQLSDSLNFQDHDVAWFHCASLGEFEQGRPLIEQFAKAYPDFKILLTFYSPSGYEIRKNYPIVHQVLYLPWDTPDNARFFVQTVVPKIAFIVKYEYWYQLLQQAYNMGTPVLLCSAIFRPNQVFFKPYGTLFRNLLKYFDHLFVQDTASQQLLSKIAIVNVTVAGDTRMDRVTDITNQVTGIASVEEFVSNAENVLVVGSSWPEDIEVLAPLINESSHTKFIIAPHEISADHLDHIEKATQRPSVRYTSGGITSAHEILIIDTIGILSSLYQYGDYAYVGGAFGKGLHNILEAATFGLPLFFGNKNFQKFREARDLVDVEGAKAIANTLQLQTACSELMQDPERYELASQACKNYVKAQTGATDIIMRHVGKLLNS